jgi:hypothetical protein
MTNAYRSEREDGIQTMIAAGMAVFFMLEFHLGKIWATNSNGRFQTTGIFTPNRKANACRSCRRATGYAGRFDAPFTRQTPSQLLVTHMFGAVSPRATQGD